MGTLCAQYYASIFMTCLDPLLAYKTSLYLRYHFDMAKNGIRAS